MFMMLSNAFNRFYHGTIDFMHEEDGDKQRHLILLLLTLDKGSS